jgi:hypothetical protein
MSGFVELSDSDLARPFIGGKGTGRGYGSAPNAPEGEAAHGRGAAEDDGTPGQFAAAGALLVFRSLPLERNQR